MARSTLVSIFLMVVVIFFAADGPVQAVEMQSLDIIVVIDNSGSMGQYDPGALRYQAARMLIDLLSDRDRIGFVTFADDASKVTEFLTLLDDPEERDDLKRIIQNAQGDDGTTNYSRGLEEAFEVIDSKSNNKKAVLFLTDGDPTDSKSDISEQLERFKNLGVPVYLMLLNTNGLVNINQMFEATGPSVIKMRSSGDIGRAFAFALSDLRPTTYIDSIEGFPGTGSSVRFQADAGTELKISEISFVFLPNQNVNSLHIEEAKRPSNAQPRNLPVVAEYAVHSYRSDDALPITGGWQFDSNTSHVTAFALIHSEIELAVSVPGSSPYDAEKAVVRGQPFVIGVNASGGDLSSARMEVLLKGTDSCFTTIGLDKTGEPYELQSVGLSENNTLFWRLLETNLPQSFAVSIELGQLSRPIRLSRCFPIAQIDLAEDTLVVERPSALDTVISGELPLAVKLTPTIAWETANAFVTDPSGQVFKVPLTTEPESGTWIGSFADIIYDGPHAIRFLAHGNFETKYAVSAYGNTIFTVKGELAIKEPNRDLGEVRQLDQSFETDIELQTMLISESVRTWFEVESIQDVKQGTDASQHILVKLCPTPEVEGNRIRCSVVITPSFDLPPGDYEIVVKVNSEGVEIENDSANFLFKRPPSSIMLVSEAADLGMVTPNDLSLSQMLQFSPLLWQGDPKLPVKPKIKILRNRETHEELKPAEKWLKAELMPQEAPLQYEFVLTTKAEQELPVGKYELTLDISSALPNLFVSPDELKIPFSKVDAYAQADFSGVVDENNVADMEGSVWGIPYIYKFLGEDVLLTVPLHTFYMNDFPEIPDPQIEQIKQSDGPADLTKEEFMTFTWRNDGPIPGTTDQYQATLIGSLKKDIPAGSYDVRLQMDSPLQEPSSQTIRVVVNGWWDALIRPILAMIPLSLAAVYIGRQRPIFTGVLRVGEYAWPLRGRENFKMIFDRPSSEFVLIPTNESRMNERVLMNVSLISKDEIKLDLPWAPVLNARLKKGTHHPHPKLRTIRYTQG